MTDGDSEQQDHLSDGILIWWTFATAVAVFALVAGVIALLDDGGGDGSSAAAGSTTATVTPVADVSSTVQADLSEFAISLAPPTVPAGHVTIDVANEGSATHNLMLEGGPMTPDLTGGGQATLDLGNLAPGTYSLLCMIPGHEAAGMRTTLTVTAAGPDTGESASGGSTETTATGGHDGHEGDEVDYAALDAAMEESVAQFPAETLGRGNQELVPTIEADGTKVFELTAAITPWEVAPGNVVDAWTYNGMVPGPVIRADVGDHVRIVIHNQLPMGTDIHFHGVTVPNDQDGVAPITQPLIRSGETYSYEFTLTEPAVGMYHAHHHGQMQVVNGLLGAFLVGEVPLPEAYVPAGTTVAQEFPMVINDAGVIGLTLNGKSFPATEPIVVQQGDWIMVHYMNEGLQAHPMHLHGFPQLVIARDGYPLETPYYADTINVAPGERYTVVVHADQPGTWVWHCHILTHVESDEGMFGMVTALVVQ